MKASAGFEKLNTNNRKKSRLDKIKEGKKLFSCRKYNSKLPKR